jgi:ribosome recycling factor
MASKQDLENLVQQLLDLIQKLTGSACFTSDELNDLTSKLQEAIDELQKVVG